MHPWVASLGWEDSPGERKGYPLQFSGLENIMDCSPRGSSAPGDSPGKNTGVGCHALLQGNLPNPGIKVASVTSPALAGGFFTICAIWEAPNTRVVSCSLLQGIFPTQGSNSGLPHCWWILCQLSYQGSTLGDIL